MGNIHQKKKHHLVSNRKRQGKTNQEIRLEEPLFTETFIEKSTIYHTVKMKKNTPIMRSTIYSEMLHYVRFSQSWIDKLI